MQCSWSLTFHRWMGSCRLFCFFFCFFFFFLFFFFFFFVVVVVVVLFCSVFLFVSSLFSPIVLGSFFCFPRVSYRCDWSSPKGSYQAFFPEFDLSDFSWSETIGSFFPLLFFARVRCVRPWRERGCLFFLPKCMHDYNNYAYINTMHWSVFGMLPL